MLRLIFISLLILDPGGKEACTMNLEYIQKLILYNVKLKLLVADIRRRIV